MALKLIAPGKRKGNKWYIVKGRIAGQQYEVVTDPPTTDPRAAAEFRDNLTVAIRQRHGSRPIQKTFAYAVERYIEAHPPSKNEERYLNRLKQHFDQRRLDGILPADMLAAAHSLYPNRSPQTKNRQVLAPLAAVLHFAAENEWCGYRVVRKLKEDKPKPRRADRGAMTKLIRRASIGDKAAPDLRRLLIILAFQGWRISEVIRINWEHINLQRRTVLVWIRKAKTWKEVPMHPAVFAELRRVPKAKRKGKLLRWATTSGPRKPLRALVRAAKVSFTPHGARHAFASDLNEKGATDDDILPLSTWTTKKSIAHYTSVSPQHARATLELLTEARPRGKTRGTPRK